MSPSDDQDGEGPVRADEARDRVKQWWNKPEHSKKAGSDERDEVTRNDDLSDTSKGGVIDPSQ